MEQSIESETQWQQCGHCKLWKALTSFSPSNRGRKGTWCKLCYKNHSREWRKKKPKLTAEEIQALPSTQWCSRCERNKDVEDFQPSRRGKSGAWCRACENICTRERRGKDYATAPSLPKELAVIDKCSLEGCTYVGTLLRGMCRKHYALWLKKTNHNLSFVDVETGNGIEIGLKCNRCKIDKPLSEFYADKNSKSGYRARCKSCLVLDNKESRWRNPEKARKNAAEQSRKRSVEHPYDPEQRKDRYLSGERDKTRSRMFGITVAEYDTKWDAQGRRCAICRRFGNAAKDRGMGIDYDHTCCSGSGSCGECVRGILCGNCNAGLGMFGDSIERLQAAQMYLLKYTDVLKR